MTKDIRQGFKHVMDENHDPPLLPLAGKMREEGKSPLAVLPRHSTRFMAPYTQDKSYRIHKALHNSSLHFFVCCQSSPPFFRPEPLLQ